MFKLINRVKLKIFVSTLLALAVGAILVVGGCGTTTGGTENPLEEDEGAITLSYAFFAPASSFPAVQMDKWAEEVEKRTGGMVLVETYPGGTLLDADGMYDGVLAGVADIGLGSPSYDPGRFPLLSGVSLPLGFNNATEASLVLYDLLEEFRPQELETFKVLTAFTNEPGYIQSVRPVESLEDLQGMELRAAGTGVQVLRTLGAAPVGMPMPEVPETVQTGVIEGTMTSREVLLDFALAELLGYVVDYPMGVVTFVAVMERDKWEALPTEVQDVMEKLGREMASFTGKYHDIENVAKAMDWAKEEHALQVISLDDDERARWDILLEPLTDEWIEEMEEKGLSGEQFLEELHRLKERHGEKVE